jgi:hypothetical protein
MACMQVQSKMDMFAIVVSVNMHAMIHHNVQFHPHTRKEEGGNEIFHHQGR